MDQLGVTSWFNRGILLRLPSVRRGVCLDTGEDKLLFSRRVMLLFLVCMMYY